MSTPESEPDPDLEIETEQSMRKEIASDMRAAVNPVKSKVQADVARVRSFFGTIRSGYLKVGLALYGATAIAGTVITATHAFDDWPMHLAMYLVILIFLLLYVRAHLRRFRVLKVFWALVGLAMLVFFSWILADLVPARLAVRAVPPGSEALPSVYTRPRTDLLTLPAILLAIQALWLGLHLIIVGRRTRRR